MVTIWCCSDSSADNLNQVFSLVFHGFIIHILQKSLSHLCQTKLLSFFCLINPMIRSTIPSHSHIILTKVFSVKNHSICPFDYITSIFYLPQNIGAYSRHAAYFYCFNSFTIFCFCQVPQTTRRYQV